MKQQDALVVGGVDAHADTHYAAALDERGALLAGKSFPTTTPGYRDLLDWLRGSARSTSSRSSRLVRMPPRWCAICAGATFRSSKSTSRTRIPAVVSARATRSTRRWPPGCSSPGKAKAVPKQTDGIVESIRLLRAARHSAVKSRSAAMVQLGDLIITARKSFATSSRAARRSAARPRSAGGCGQRQASCAGPATRRS
jgi:transposase